MSSSDVVLEELSSLEDALSRRGQVASAGGSALNQIGDSQAAGEERVLLVRAQQAWREAGFPPLSGHLYEHHASS